MSNWTVVFVIKSVYMIMLLLSDLNSPFSAVKTTNLHRKKCLVDCKPGDPLWIVRNT